MVMPQDLISQTDTKMSKSVEALSRNLDTVRTGRANPALVEGILVDYYGTPTPLIQLGSISVPEPRVLMVQPWDKQAVVEVEKSILKSDIGLVPNNDGTNIRINIPELTEERRKDLAKVVRQKSEEAKVSVRNIRRDTLEQIRGMEKDKRLSADDSRQFQTQLQKLTDQHIGNMDNIASRKEAEIMEV